MGAHKGHIVKFIFIKFFISLLNAGLRQVLKELMANKESELLYYISVDTPSSLDEVSSLSARSIARHIEITLPNCDAI